MSEQNELAKRRQEIDELDARIVAAISQRLEIAGQIGQLKSAAAASDSVDAADFAREEQVIRTALASAGEQAAGIEPVMRSIIGLCMSRQRPLRVAYLGPPGTFSNEAARARFGCGAELIAAASMAGCLKMVEADAADYALVPFENSTDGGVGEAMDEIVAGSLVASAETYLRIRQCLLAASGVELAGIKRLYSHPQSFAQCRRWLDANLGDCSRVACDSNAAAAEKAAADGPVAAAIGPAGAADGRGLQVLVASIEDNPRNITRFLVMGRKQARPSGADCTSVMFAVRHRPGALLEMLRIIADAKINMTKLESRPIPGGSMGQGQYLFFVDLDGHRDQQPLAGVLDQLQKEAAQFRLIGSYPRAANAEGS